MRWCDEIYGEERHSRHAPSPQDSETSACGLTNSNHSITGRPDQSLNLSGPSHTNIHPLCNSCAFLHPLLCRRMEKNGRRCMLWPNELAAPTEYISGQHRFSDQKVASYALSRIWRSRSVRDHRDDVYGWIPAVISGQVKSNQIKPG